MTKKDLDYIKVIGKGSFGLVYLARKKGSAADSTPFAVKQIEKDHLVQTGQQFNVVREKLIMHQMSHPHIASLFSTYSDPRSLYVPFRKSLKLQCTLDYDEHSDTNARTQVLCYGVSRGRSRVSLVVEISIEIRL